MDEIENQPLISAYRQPWLGTNQVKPPIKKHKYTERVFSLAGESILETVANTRMHETLPKKRWEDTKPGLTGRSPAARLVAMGATLSW
jgi:hypothetical protein